MSTRPYATVEMIKDEISKLFDWADYGLPRAYFELPTPDWDVDRHVYAVIARQGEDGNKVVGDVINEVKKLRATVPGRAWLFWRRDPVVEPIKGPHGDVTEEEYEDLPDVGWRVRIRIAVPRADWSEISLDPARELS